MVVYKPYRDSIFLFFNTKQSSGFFLLSCFVLFIQESTYGTHIHENRDERERRFTRLVHDIVNRGGRCLVPVFALGRAQELLLILGMPRSNAKIFLPFVLSFN